MSPDNRAGLAEPVVDVLITAYNAERTVAAAVASIQQQSLVAIRIVVVDDGSIDSTANVVEALAASDTRIVVVRKEHSGIVPSLRAGLEHCHARYLARFDADDLADSNRLAVQWSQLEADTGCNAVASAARHIDANDRVLGTVTLYAPLNQADPTWVPCREPYLLQPFLMVRRAAFDAVGGYRSCEVAEDSDLYWRLSECGKLRNTPDVLGSYRLHADSISSRSIVRGRRIALWSQLVGLSAQRRRSGGADLEFDDQRLRASASAISLEQHCLVGSVGLTASEILKLRASIAVKLLEVAAYRPFDLEDEDCRFARAAIDAVEARLTPANRDSIEREVTAAGMRLIHGGRIRVAYLLLGRRFARVAAHSTYRRVLTETFRNRLKRFFASSLTRRCQGQAGFDDSQRQSPFKLWCDVE